MLNPSLVKESSPRTRQARLQEQVNKIRTVKSVQGQRKSRFNSNTVNAVMENYLDQSLEVEDSQHNHQPSALAQTSDGQFEHNLNMHQS